MAIQPLFSAGAGGEIRRAEAWLSTQMARAKKERFALFVRVTPALAEMLLEQNPSNRKQSPLVIEKYARDMTAGRWKVNGQGVIVSACGQLNDGQHRLMAIVESGTAVEMLIVFGVERESRDTLDTGKKREIGDFLQMAGHENARHLGTALRYVYQIEKYGQLTGRRECRPTEQEMIEQAGLHKQLPECFHAVPTRNVQIYGGRSLLVFSLYVFRHYDEEKADEFIQRLLDGVGIGPGHPVYTLREYFHHANRQKSRIDEQGKAIRIFRAWNAFKNGRTLKVIQPGDNDLRGCL